MRFSFYDNLSTPLQLLFVVLVMLCCFLVGFAGAFLLLLAFGNLPLETLLQALSDPSSPYELPMLRFLQVVQGIFLFVVPPLLIAFLFSAQRKHYLSIRPPSSARILWASGLLIILAFPAINGLSALNQMVKLPPAWSGFEMWMQQLEEAARVVTEKFVLDPRISVLAFNLFMMAILPAIGEEFFFRGVLQNIITRWTGSAYASVWITGILFSLIHFQFYGFLPRALLGVLFGYLLVWSGSIWVPVFANFVNNAFSVFFYFLIARGVVTPESSEFGGGAGEWIFAIISLLLATQMVVYLRRKQEKSVVGQEGSPGL